jgi:hypothetical protein
MVEKFMFKLNLVATLAIVASCAGASTASAAATWPTSIVGTWNGVSNQTQIVLTVTKQKKGGKCQVITGTMLNVGADTTAIQGYYCPSSGTVEFLRFPTGGNTAFQVYNANLNQANAGAPQLMISGSFGQYSPAYGPLGQYAFSVFH